MAQEEGLFRAQVNLEVGPPPLRGRATHIQICIGQSEQVPWSTGMCGSGLPAPARSPWVEPWLGFSPTLIL